MEGSNLHGPTQGEGHREVLPQLEMNRAAAVEGIWRASLRLHTEGVVWVVDHPVRYGWPRRKGEGEAIAPRDLWWRGDAYERVIPRCT